MSPGTIHDMQQYLKYTPIVYLDEHEQYFPGSIEEFLDHMKPYQKHQPIQDLKDLPLTLNNLDQLNSYGSQNGLDIFLTSNEDRSTYPNWQHGIKSSPSGQSNNFAPVILVPKFTRDETGKETQVMDMFSFYFFNFNAGPRLPIDPARFFGDHLGDLEYSLVRFVRGVPKHVYLSRHASGTLTPFNEMEQRAGRPVIYAARGTHALYGISGNHQYIMPDADETKILDYTSKGILWDPLKNIQVSSYSTTTKEFTALQPKNAPIAWLKFNGYWSDQEYSTEDPRQAIECGQSKWGNGPDFIVRKNLDRRSVRSLRFVLKERFTK